MFVLVMSHPASVQDATDSALFECGSGAGLAPSSARGACFQARVLPVKIHQRSQRSPRETVAI